MVILSLPSMPNSFFGHADKYKFYGRDRPSHIDPNQVCPIPDRLPLRFVHYPASSLFRHQADARQIAKHTSGDELRAYGQKFFLSRPNLSPPDYVEGDGHL
jgi:hypothetical protein